MSIIFAWVKVSRPNPTVIWKRPELSQKLYESDLRVNCPSGEHAVGGIMNEKRFFIQGEKNRTLRELNKPIMINTPNSPVDQINIENQNAARNHLVEQKSLWTSWIVSFQSLNKRCRIISHQIGMLELEVACVSSAL